MSSGRNFLSNLKLYTDFLKWNNHLSRYERWDEAVEDIVLNTHRKKYGDKLSQEQYQRLITDYSNRLILGSQRSLQYRGSQIFQHNVRIYNCATLYCYSSDSFSKGFYVLLCGAGLGVHLGSKFVKQLPNINRRTLGTKTHIVQDSIEGWADAAEILISSYTHTGRFSDFFGYEVKFDFNLIRPKGSYISGGFKAPGAEGLKQSLESIEKLINNYLGNDNNLPFKSIIAYDIFMHLSNAVLSGGVRRSAMNVLFFEDDKEMIEAKLGNWRQFEPQRARSNNSVVLLRQELTQDKLNYYIGLNQGDNDLGFVLTDHEDQHFNPCFEIGFNFYEKIKDRSETVIQFCNLSEINASKCTDNKGRFSKEMFFRACESAAMFGTLQAGFTEFPYLGKQTEEIVAGEALLGVSITGWMMRPELFDADILREGAEIVKKTNLELSKQIGINPAARCTTVKPSGNASVILETSSGIHAEHSEKYFRVMQLNKEADLAKYLLENYPEMLENSLWSATNSDYVVYVPIINSETTLFKDSYVGIKHLELIKLVQDNWIMYGKNPELCYDSKTNHNVSCTVIIDDPYEVSKYIFDHKNSFTAVSFLSSFGDKDYAQSPNTSIFNTEELYDKYGDGVLFASGLIVDALHYFNDDLWKACDISKNSDIPLVGTRDQIILQKDWLRRLKKFSKNFFKGDIDKTIYCLKDVHLYHKWCKIHRNFKKVPFEEILKSPNYKDISDYSAQACSGGACDI